MSEETARYQARLSNERSRNRANYSRRVERGERRVTVFLDRQACERLELLQQRLNAPRRAALEYALEKAAGG